jgi:superfamily II DNA or RNA helicase
MIYEDFISSKSLAVPPTGMEKVPRISSKLFPFQRDLVKLSLRRGRSAIFADTGLGKGWMALEWLRHVAKHTDRPVLLLAPLAVSHQFAREADKFGVPARVVARQSDVGPGINITNYHKLDHFDADTFGGVALDESSILKSYTASTRTALIEAFKLTPFRLALTATPSPNDHTELGNHAEFLGVMSRVEMLSMFFVHDGETTQEWRLKGHAEKAFWEWVASWAVSLRKPSDLGYEDGAYALPPLRMHSHAVAVNQRRAFDAGVLFADAAATLSEQRDVRKETIGARVELCADLVRKADGPVVVWCDLNAEGDALERAVPDCVQVAGADDDDEKEAKLDAFATGGARVIVTKPSVAGFGMNWQHAATQVFCGLSNSFEQFYQSIRRSYRFGQTRPVDVHVVTSELDGRIVENLARKQADAQRMGDAMVAAMAETVKKAIGATTRTIDKYEAREPMKIAPWVVSNEERL